MKIPCFVPAPPPPNHEKGPNNGLHHQCKLKCKSQLNFLGTTPNFPGSGVSLGNRARTAWREGKMDGRVSGPPPLPVSWVLLCVRLCFRAITVRV